MYRIIPWLRWQQMVQQNKSPTIISIYNKKTHTCTTKKKHIQQRKPLFQMCKDQLSYRLGIGIKPTHTKHFWTHVGTGLYWILSLNQYNKK